MIARASRNMDSYEWKIRYRHLPAPQNMHDYTDCTFSQAAEQMISTGETMLRNVRRWIA